MHCIITLGPRYSWGVHHKYSFGGFLPGHDRLARAHAAFSCFLRLADEAVRTLIRLVQPQLQETVATAELGKCDLQVRAVRAEDGMYYLKMVRYRTSGVGNLR